MQMGFRYIINNKYNEYIYLFLYEYIFIINVYFFIIIIDYLKNFFN